MPHPTEEQCANFRALFEMELRYVWLTLRRLGVPAADAEDLAHDIFLQIYAKIADYDATRPARPYLFAYAYRFASDYRKRVHRRPETLVGCVDTDLQPSAGGPLPDALLAERDRRAFIDAAVQSIDIDQRAVLIAYELDEIPMKDVADSLGIPVNTAYSRLRLAREGFANAVRRLRKTQGEP